MERSMRSAVIFLCFLVACSRQDNVVRVGALLPLSGSGANYGKSLQQGLELAATDINATGGIGGKKLQIIYEDSQGDAKTGVSGFNKLISVDNVPVVIGSISSVVLAVAPIADQKGVVLLNTSAISPKICDRATDYLFSFMVSGADEARFMARSFAAAHGASPIAVLYSNNASGIDTKDVFTRALTDAGGRVAVSEGYDLNSSDFRTQLAKIKYSNAKFGYLIAFSSDEFGRILKQSRELDLRLQWYSYSGFETRETLLLAGDAAEGVIYSYPSYGRQIQNMESLQNRYHQAYGSWADIYTVTSFDALKLLAQIMNSGGSSPPSIRDNLRKAHTATGIFGPISFGTPQCVSRDLEWKTVENGQYLLRKSAL